LLIYDYKDLFFALLYYFIGPIQNAVPSHAIQNAQLALAMEKAELILKMLPNPLMTRIHSTAFNDTALKTALKEKRLHAAFLQNHDLYPVEHATHEK
jgi:hypothetical protein